MRSSLVVLEQLQREAKGEQPLLRTIVQVTLWEFACEMNRVLALCEATQTAANNLPPFPFSNFDPLNPDPTLLPQVSRFFNHPAPSAAPGLAVPARRTRHASGAAGRVGQGAPSPPKRRG